MYIVSLIRLTLSREWSDGRGRDKDRDGRGRKGSRGRGPSQLNNVHSNND